MTLLSYGAAGCAEFTVTADGIAGPRPRRHAESKLMINVESESVTVSLWSPSTVSVDTVESESLWTTVDYVQLSGSGCGGRGHQAGVRGVAAVLLGSQWVHWGQWGVGTDTRARLGPHWQSRWGVTVTESLRSLSLGTCQWGPGPPG